MMRPIVFPGEVKAPRFRANASLRPSATGSAVKFVAGEQSALTIKSRHPNVTVALKALARHSNGVKVLVGVV